MLPDELLNRAQFVSPKTVVHGQLQCWVEPELCLPIRVLHMDVQPQLLAGKEVESKPAGAKNGRAHTPKILACYVPVLSIRQVHFRRTRMWTRRDRQIVHSCRLPNDSLSCLPARRASRHRSTQPGSAPLRLRSSHWFTYGRTISVRYDPTMPPRAKPPPPSTPSKSPRVHRRHPAPANPRSTQAPR